MKFLEIARGLSLAITIGMEEDPLIAIAENPRNIVGIYKYCDRWCERCLFTDRCLQYQSQSNASGALDDTGAECVRTHPIVRAGDAYADLVAAWFESERRALLDRADQLVARADRVFDANPLVNEAVQVKQALQIIAHDFSFLRPQLSRAVGERVRQLRGTCSVERGQNDSDGFAKAALISIDRSEAAWRLLAEWMGGCTTAVLLADTLSQLRAHVELEFPAARQFTRPGFDHASF